MTRLMLLAPIAVLLASGCHTTVVNQPPPPQDVATPMGARGIYGYHVAANAAFQIPTNDIGFGVAANGANGYSLAFSDPGSSVYFSGTISSDGGIANYQLTGTSVQVTINADGSLNFYNGLHGESIAFNTNAEPIYLNLSLNNNPLATGGFGVYFTGAATGQIVDDLTYDPIAFTSP